MKHTLLSTLLGFTCLLSTQGQVANCPPGSAAIILDVNNVSAMMQNGGDKWWDLVGQAQYEVPRGSGRNAFFTQSLWVGGMDGTTLRLAGQRYRQNGHDYFPGPIPVGAGVSTATCAAFDRYYGMTKGEIMDFLLGRDTSSGIWDWPGRANPHTNMYDQELAPFEDVNGDNIYDPMDGDYPKIRGDQAYWWVINDVGNIHTSTLGEPIGLEVHVMAYAYSTNDVLDNTTFYDYTLIKRTAGDLQDTYFGMFTDVDLGNPGDDYLACHSTENMLIGYNGFPNDLDAGGALGYGAHPPAVSVKLVDLVQDNQGNAVPMSSFAALRNDASAVGDPVMASEYYNVLQGKWRNGTPITSGGNGYGGTTPYPFMYNAADTALGWTECSAGNSPSDRRGVISFGPFTMTSGSIYKFTSAAIWARKANETPTCDSLGTIVEASRTVQAFVDSTTSCAGYAPIYTATIDSADPGMNNGAIAVTIQSGTVSTSRWSAQGGVGLNLSGVAPGDYSLLLADNSNCYYKATFTVPSSVPAGINEPTLADLVSVYPNPTTGLVTLDQQAPQALDVQVLDMTGRHMRSLRIPEQERFVMDLNDLPQGMYFLRLQNSQQSSSLRLLITR